MEFGKNKKVEKKDKEVSSDWIKDSEGKKESLLFYLVSYFPVSVVQVWYDVNKL